VSKDGKPLTGAAKSSSIKKCEGAAGKSAAAAGCEAKAVDKSGKPFQLRSSPAVEAALPPKKKGKARRPAEVPQPA